MSAANARRWSTKLAALDANLLVALDALLQEASVTRAARRLGVTQSAMSQTLGRLRRSFDDPLLVRVGREMELTPFAKRIAERLRAAVGELEAVLADRPLFDPASSRRRFVVAMVDYLAFVLLPGLGPLLAGRAPAVDLAVRALEARSIAPQLERGEVDLYVGVLGEAERGLASAPLFREGFRVLARAGHPALGGSVDRYVESPHVLVSPRREAGSIVDRALAELELERRVAVEVPYFGPLPGLLAHSDLVATVPEWVARELTRDPRLEDGAPPIALPEIEIHLAWHPRFDAEPGVVWLREALRELVAGA